MFSEFRWSKLFPWQGCIDDFVRFFCIEKILGAPFLLLLLLLRPAFSEIALHVQLHTVSFIQFLSWVQLHAENCINFVIGAFV